MVCHVGRILAGQKLYVKPTIEFVPFVYQPFFYYVATLAAKMVGLNYLALRLVSHLATLGVLILIFDYVRRDTGSKSRPSISMPGRFFPKMPFTR